MGAESIKQNGDTTTTTTALEAMHIDIKMREAFEQVAPEADALDPEDLAVVHTDVAVATKTVGGCLEKIAPFRPLIVKSLPDFPIATFDKLPAYAQAAMLAHVKLAAASREEEPVQQIVDAMLPLRDQLLSDATTLAKRGLIDGTRLEGIKGPIGYLNASSDTLLLCELFREHWSAVEGKTAVTPEELDKAWDLAEQLRAAVGKREQAEVVATKAADTRIRHYTLFVNAYDQVRGAITYLRWKERDADKFAPPLYNPRKSGKKSDDEETVEPSPALPIVATPGNGGATNGNGRAPVVNGNGNGAVTNGSGSNGTPTNGTAAQPAPGMPGDEPFHR